MSAPKRPAACTAVDKIRITGQDPRQIDDKKGLPTVIIDPKSGSPVDSVYMPMVTVRLVDGLGAEVAPSARGRAKDEAKLAKGLAKDKDTKAKVANGEYKVVAEYSSVIFFPAKAGAELEKFAESIFTVEANYTLKEFQKAHFAYLQNVKERKGRFIDPLTGVARAVYTEGAKAVDEEDEMAALGGGDQEAKVAGDFVCRSVKVSAQTPRPRGDALGEASALSDLCAFFVDAPPEERKRGEVSSTPILLVCGPGEGKSVMLTTLAYEIAISCELESLRCGGPLDKKGNQPPWQGALPLLPISLESAKLLRIIYGRRDPLLECDLDGTPLALLEYVASEFAGDEPRVRLLKAALRLRACVLLIDDFDFSISKGRASQLRSFLVGTVAHQHYRMMVACRSTQYVHTLDCCLIAIGWRFLTNCCLIAIGWRSLTNCCLIAIGLRSLTNCCLIAIGWRSLTAHDGLRRWQVRGPVRGGLARLRAHGRLALAAPRAGEGRRVAAATVWANEGALVAAHAPLRADLCRA
jgi:hypothetical protein